MKNLKIIFGIGIIVSLLFGCSSVRITDSWRGSKTLNIKKKNILVVSKTEDRATQIRFEKDMVLNLNKNGLTSIESHIKFPNSDPTEKVEKNKEKEIIKNLRNNNIDIIIISHLVDSRKYKNTITTNENIYPFPYRYRSFYDYANQFHQEQSTIEMEGTTYILETLVYDITQQTQDQLISIITSEVDNPNNLSTTSNEFSKSIIKDLMK
ncbi:hypothetical protein [uncultured Maribacter sp.]|uniref:hypothetical protein n=1 Tax=uncultured Maribacter sp. TaxID=431308 RepID=UPI002613D36B|nr:hypothetical protein [uncultured Maribacter sp.]